MTNSAGKHILIKSWPFMILFLYTALNLVLLFHHENWRDEAQAWQIVKYLSVPEIFAQLKYEGHPFLWYLVLLPFAKLGMPFAGMGLISLACMVAAVWVILKKAPFSLPVKIVLIFGSSFVYFYPVISRSYCLIPPLLAWLAVLYPDRQDKPILYGGVLALLTQTHIYMLGITFLLSAFWLLEILEGWIRKRLEAKTVCQNGAGLGISLFSGLFLIWELAGSVGSNTLVDIHLSSSLNSNLHRLHVATQWTLDYVLGLHIKEAYWKYILLLLGIALILFVVYSWKEALIFGGVTLIQILMFTYVYLPSHQKAMILMHELIFILWIAMVRRQEKRWQKRIWEMALVCLSLLSIYGYRDEMLQDIREPYSSSKEMAAYIQEYIAPETPVVSTKDTWSIAAAAYLDEREIWDPILEENVRFSTWNNRRSQSITYEEMERRVRGKYPSAEGMYLICGTDSNIADLVERLPLMEEKYSVAVSGTDENATLYYVSFNK